MTIKKDWTSNNLKIFYIFSAKLSIVTFHNSIPTYNSFLYLFENGFGILCVKGYFIVLYTRENETSVYEKRISWDPYCWISLTDWCNITLIRQNYICQKSSESESWCDFSSLVISVQKTWFFIPFPVEKSCITLDLLYLKNWLVGKKCIFIEIKSFKISEI